MDETHIRLADGTEYAVHFCCINMVDSSLSIQITNKTEDEVRAMFANPAALAQIIYYDCGVETVYSGYTRLGSVSEARPGLVIASLFR